MHSRHFMSVKAESRFSQLDYCGVHRKERCDSFADRKECETVFIDYFAQCVRRDDIEQRPGAADFRVILPGTLTVIHYFVSFSNSLFSNVSILFKHAVSRSQ